MELGTSKLNDQVQSKAKSDDQEWSLAESQNLSNISILSTLWYYRSFSSFSLLIYIFLVGLTRVEICAIFVLVDGRQLESHVMTALFLAYLPLMLYWWLQTHELSNLFYFVIDKFVSMTNITTYNTASVCMDFLFVHILEWLTANRHLKVSIETNVWMAGLSNVILGSLSNRNWKLHWGDIQT